MFHRTDAAATCRQYVDGEISAAMKARWNVRPTMAAEAFYCPSAAIIPTVNFLLEVTMKTSSIVTTSYFSGQVHAAKPGALATQPGNGVKLSVFRTASFRSALLAGGLMAGLGGGAAALASDDTAEIKPHSESIGAAITDTATTAKVKSSLMAEDSLKKSDIDVTTTNGVVSLDGTVSSSKAKSTAETLAGSVDGVKSVDNNLRTPDSSENVAKTKQAVADSWITTKVKTEIVASSVSNGIDVNVVTVQGVVALKGILPNQETINKVKAIAANVDGVKSVDTSALRVAGN